MALGKNAKAPFETPLPWNVPAQGEQPAFSVVIVPPTPPAEGPVYAVKVGTEEHQLKDLSTPTWEPYLSLYVAPLRLPIAVCVAGESTYSHSHVLYRFVPRAPYAIQLVSAAELDWRPYRNAYSFVETRTDLPYGLKMMLWESEAGIGDWRKGTRKTLVSGSVYVTSASLRPAR